MTRAVGVQLFYPELVLTSMLHTYKTNPGDVAGYRGPKGIVGVGIILLVSLTSAMGVILRK